MGVRTVPVLTTGSVLYRAVEQPARLATVDCEDQAPHEIGNWSQVQFLTVCSEPHQTFAVIPLGNVYLKINFMMPAPSPRVSWNAICAAVRGNAGFRGNNPLYAPS